VAENNMRGITVPFSTACVCTVLLAFSADADSQAPAPSKSADVLDEIVVIAHKIPRETSQIAANVTVLSSEEIDNTLSTSLADVFRYTPGIDHEANGTRFGTEGINIRGIGGNRVAMLIDGVPISDQFDVGSFANATRDFVNAGLIDRVEVLHGPASALYGSAAIGGVISTRTPDPSKFLSTRRTGGNLNFTHRGADASVHSTGLLALGDPSFGLLLGGSLREGEEVDSAAATDSLDQRDYRRRSFIGKYVADDRFGNEFRVGLIHQESDVRSALNAMRGSGRFRNTTALEGDDEYDMQLLYAAYRFDNISNWFDGGIARIYQQNSDADQQTLDERGLATRPVSIDRQFSFSQELRGAEINLYKTLSGSKAEHKIGIGLEYRRRHTTEIRDALETGIEDGLQTNNLLGEEFPLRDFPISRSTDWGAYIEDSIAYDNWTLIAALRFDRFSLDPEHDPIYDEDFPFADPISISESDVSPKLGLIYHVADNAEVFLQYAHGFRAPPYADANIGLEIPLFNVRAISNPDLRSEKSDGADLGFRWRGVRSSVRISVFYTRYSDFIESKRRIGVDPISGRLLFQSQNLNRTVIQGIEGNWGHRFSGRLENFDIDGSFYAAWGENKDNGEPLNSLGPSQMVLGIGWTSTDQNHTGRLRGTFTEKWSRRDTTAGELFEPPGNASFDLILSKRFPNQLTARVAVLNLTDRAYWRWSNIRGLSPSDAVIPYLAQAGRSFGLSLHKNWQ